MLIRAVERRSCWAIPGEAEDVAPPALAEVARLLEAVERPGCEAILGDAEGRSPSSPEDAGFVAAAERWDFDATLGEVGEDVCRLPERMVRRAGPQQQVHQSGCRAA